MKLHRLLLSKLYGRLEALKAENERLKIENQHIRDQTESEKNEILRQQHSFDQVVSIEYAPTKASPLYHQGRTLILPLDRLMIPLVLRDGIWDGSMLEFARSVLAKLPGPYYFFDVGANVGLITREFLAQFPSIIGASCYEPDPGHFALLKRNNDVFEKALLFNYALSNTAGKTTFYRNDANMGAHSLLPQRTEPQASSELIVDCLKVTDELMLNSVPAEVGLIWKSDTEGYDEIIATELSLAFWTRVDLAMMELLPIEKPTYDISKFEAILDAFPRKYFASDLAKEVSTSEILSYLRQENVPHQNLYMAK